MSKIRFQPSQYHRLTMAFHMSRSSNVPRYDRLIAIGNNGIPTFSEWYYGPEQWMMANIEYLNIKSSVIHSEMKINIAYQQNKESRFDRRYGSRWLRRQNETVHSISTNIDLNKRINKTFDVFYGVEAVVNINKSVGNRLDVRMDTSQRFTSRYPNSTWHSYAAYISSRAKIGDKWTINAGLRYNYFLVNGSFDTSLFRLPYNKTKNTFGTVTGSAGVVFLPKNSWRIYANFASGFRAPNVDDIGKVFETVPGLLVVPNSNLKPEYSFNGELGIEKRFGNVAQIMVVGYYNHLLNALSLAPFQIDGKDSLFFDGRNNSLRAIQNSSYADVWGVQAMVRFYFGNGFGAWASYNYQNGREKLLTNNGSELYPMRHVAPMFGSVHITYQRKKFSADIYTDFSGSVKHSNLAVKTMENLIVFPNDENGNPFSPSWHTINFKASYDIAKFLTLNGGVENITDQQYRTYSSGINAPGINFIIGLRARF
jgi:hemoglobin/transferrin/lactoferrin receptor protein